MKGSTSQDSRHLTTEESRRTVGSTPQDVGRMQPRESLSIRKNIGDWNKKEQASCLPSEVKSFFSPSQENK